VRQYLHLDTLLIVAHYFLLISPLYGPLVVGGLSKSLAFLVLVCLLLFVATNAATICRALIACLHSLAVSLCAPVAYRAFTVPTIELLPAEPSLAALFQRPPPAFPF
jgi:hypothetical protein